MNILYLSENNCDYLANLLLHGLRQVEGSNVVDFPRLDTAYKGLPQANYGNSFTAFNLLSDDGIDRTDLLVKIKAKFFDLVVYAGSQVYSDNNPENFPFYSLLRENRPKYWAVVDGADELSESSIRVSNFPNDIQFFCRENRGLLSPASRGFGSPISFSIPKEKIPPYQRTRQWRWAPYEPTMRYAYSSEKAYYADYSNSKLALTRRRGGWDCLRHYEIMANGCVPFFLGIQHCPQLTCESLPKELLIEVQQRFFQEFDSRRGLYPTPPKPYDDYAKWYPPVDNALRATHFSFLEEMSERVYAHCNEFCTTEAEAKKFLGNLR